MSAPNVIESLIPFKGQFVTECLDEIERLAFMSNLSVNVLDPTYNVILTGDDSARLNVKTNSQAIITSFSIG